MLVWEVSRDSKNERVNSVVGLAYTLYSTYSSWTADNREHEYWMKVPEDIGVGVDVGHAIRVTFENGSDDYVGRPVNYAAKMQDLARPRGGVVIQEEVWEHLHMLRDKFPKSSEVIIGKEMVSVRATENVNIPSLELDPLNKMV